MTDYLSKVDRTGRIVIIVCLGLTTLIWAALSFLVVILLMDEKLRATPGPLVGCGLLFGFMTWASGWMFLRLLRRTRSANQITMMPVWFIQVFGLFFAAGIVFAAVVGVQSVFVIEGLVVALSMIFLPRLMRKRPLQESAASPESHQT